MIIILALAYYKPTNHIQINMMKDEYILKCEMIIKINIYVYKKNTYILCGIFKNLVISIFLIRSLTRNCIRIVCIVFMHIF